VIAGLPLLHIALHHASGGGGFLGNWLGPLVIVVLVLAGLAWASRSRRG
jgi:hypothetical protein